MEAAELDVPRPMVRLPARSRINVRMILVALVVLAPVAGVTTMLVRSSLNKGIVDMGDMKKVDLKQMGFFQFNDKTGALEDVPARYRALDGERITTSGFLFSVNNAEGGHDFQLVYNVANCCFNGPPLVQERVFVHSDKGIDVSQSQLVQVIGTLHVKIERDGSETIQTLYTMDVERIEIE